MKIYTKQFYILLFVYLLIGTGFVLFRPVFSDEGFYIWTARNVWQGKLLYVDFIYHQFPLFPYLYAPFSDLGLASYYIMKLISVLLILGLIFLLYKHILIVTLDYQAAYFGVLLLIFNGMFMDWDIVVKSFAMTNFLCYLSFFMVMLLKYDGTLKDKYQFLLTGLISGLSSNLRVVFWSCTVILFIYLYYTLHKSPISKKKKYYNLIYFILGVLFSSLITIYFLIKYSDYFLFGVIKHNYYAQQNVWEEESNALRWLKFFLMPQSFILFVFLIIGLGRKFRFKILSILFICALFVSNAGGYFVNLYLTVLVPYIIYIGSVNYRTIKERFIYKGHNLLKYAVIFYVAAFFITIPYFRNWIEGKILEPNLLKLNEIVDYENSLKGDKIYSCWYIYSIFSNKKSECINNDFIYGCMVGKPTSEETQKYSLPDSAHISNIIKDKYFDVIVLNENIPYALMEHFDEVKMNYRLNRVFGNVKIFTKY